MDIPIKPAAGNDPYNDESPFVEKRTAAGYETGAGVESPESKEFSKEKEEDVSAGSGKGYHSADMAPGENSSNDEEEYPSIISDPFLLDEDNEGYRRDDLGKPRESYALETQVFNLAGVMTRGAAFIVDIIIITLTAFISARAGLYFAGGFGAEIYGSDRVLTPLYLALLILASTYFVFLHGLTGTTIGKMLMGIKLINNEGDNVGLWDSFVRWVGYYVSASFLFAGFFWSLFDRESQTWHDKIAGTYVVKD
ncbi:MAG: RDD family protein [Deltaproteobacteria bacterium]